jgi:predicted site-specific integrase-resolvase
VKWLNTKDICDELQISPRTLEKWRARGKGPRMLRLPNGQLRTRDDWLEQWLDVLLEESP